MENTLIMSPWGGKGDKDNVKLLHPARNRKSLCHEHYSRPGPNVHSFWRYLIISQYSYIFNLTILLMVNI